MLRLIQDTLTDTITQHAAGFGVIGETSGETAGSYTETRGSFTKTRPSCAAICGEALPLRKSLRIAPTLDRISARFSATGATSAVTLERSGVIGISTVGTTTAAILTTHPTILTAITDGGIACSVDSRYATERSFSPPPFSFASGGLMARPGL